MTEAELRHRQKERSDLDIRDLSIAERSRFQEYWDRVQRGFVDDSHRAVHDADRLVVEIMRTRGYPVDDVDRWAQDISVDHPEVVQHYREAREVRDASESGPVDTERGRLAVTSYRSLVGALLSGNGHEPHDQNHPTEERTR